MRNLRESVLGHWAPLMPSAEECHAPVFPFLCLWSLPSPPPGFLVLSSFKLADVDVSPPYPTLCNAPRLAICRVGNPLSIVNTGSQSRAIAEVVALVALLSGIPLSPELLGRYGRHWKYRAPVSVLCVRACWLLASLPSPASHALDPLAPYCYI